MDAKYVFYGTGVFALRKPFIAALNSDFWAAKCGVCNGVYWCIHCLLIADETVSVSRFIEASITERPSLVSLRSQCRGCG